MTQSNSCAPSPTATLIRHGAWQVDTCRVFRPAEVAPSAEPSDAAPSSQPPTTGAFSESSTTTEGSVALVTPAPVEVLPDDEPDWILPMDIWQRNIAHLKTRRHAVGVWIAPDDDPWQLQHALGQAAPDAPLSFVAIDFPAFTDGRGYSHAQVIRQHLKYDGEMRAVGDVLIDTMFYMHRCGFDSFVLKPGHDPAKAVQALHTFSHAYQRGYSAA